MPGRAKQAQGLAHGLRHGRVKRVMPGAWHDFGGFPSELYALQYPAAGSPALAAEVLDVLKEVGMAADSDAERPLDHGAWVPLMHLFPKAHVPVARVTCAFCAGVQPLCTAFSPWIRLRGLELAGSGINSRAVSHSEYK